MIKSILRETCIMVLLCTAIVLILGIIFYDYIPSNKTVPSKIEAYSTPENIQKEIEAQVIEDDQKNETHTYTITGADLNLYKQTNSLVSGKPDPFAASPTPDNIGNEEGGGEQTTGGETSQTPADSPSQVTDPNSTGTFFNDMGLK